MDEPSQLTLPPVRARDVLCGLNPAEIALLMLKLLLASTFATAGPAFGETLLSGAVYFDSKNTFLEVQDLIGEKNTEELARLFKHNHISEKIPADMAIVLLLSGPDPESKAEFHFLNDPTTYWTYSKYVKNDGPKDPPSLPHGRNSTLPADLPSSLTSASHLPLSAPVSLEVRKVKVRTTSAHAPLRSTAEQRNVRPRSAFGRRQKENLRKVVDIQLE